jgi:hypothetical protein
MARQRGRKQIAYFLKKNPRLMAGGRKTPRGFGICTNQVQNIIEVFA